MENIGIHRKWDHTVIMVLAGKISYTTTTVFPAVIMMMAVYKYCSLILPIIWNL